MRGDIYRTEQEGTTRHTRYLTIAGFLPLILSSTQRRDAITPADAPWRPARVTKSTPGKAVTLLASPSIYLGRTDPTTEYKGRVLFTCSWR